MCSVVQVGLFATGYPTVSLCSRLEKKQEAGSVMGELVYMMW